MRYVVPIIIIILAFIGANSIYVVSQGHAAAVSRFGKLEAAGVGPGLHFKIPFTQDIVVYDARMIPSQAEPGDCTTADGEAVRVGFNLLWQVADPAAYFRATSASDLQTTQQMEPMVRAALCKEVAHTDLSALLASANGGLGTQVRDAVAGEIRQKFGVDLREVSVGRVLPPETALAALYKRMDAEAKVRSDAVQADGAAAAAEVRAAGDAQDQQTLDAAKIAAAAVRGKGDAAAAKIYAAASAKDPQFFRYWTSLETWQQSFSKGGAVVVLDKGSPLLQAIDTNSGAAGPATKKP